MKRQSILDWEFAFIIALAIGGGVSIIHAAEISEFLSPREYLFRIGTLRGEQVQVERMELNYDFSKKEGYISFIPHQLSDIFFTFPAIVSEKNSHVQILACSTFAKDCKELDKLTVNVTYTDESEDNIPKTTLTLHDYSEAFGRLQKIIINFSIDMEPNGEFRLWNTDQVDFVGGRHHFNFVLGNKYGCYSERCVIPITGVTLDDEYAYRNFYRNFKIDFQGGGHGSNRFLMLGLNKGAIFNRTFFLGLGISLISAFIVLSFQFVIGLMKLKH